MKPGDGHSLSDWEWNRNWQDWERNEGVSGESCTGKKLIYSNCPRGKGRKRNPRWLHIPMWQRKITALKQYSSVQVRWLHGRKRGWCRVRLQSARGENTSSILSRLHFKISTREPSHMSLLSAESPSSEMWCFFRMAYIILDKVTLWNYSLVFKLLCCWVI